MPIYLHLDPNDPNTGFVYTPDSEIVTMYENGLAMKSIVRALMWQDGIKKKAVAERRVYAALMQYATGGVRLLPCESTGNPFT